MVQEQEQRILGYFIDEAKDHLNTIEQGLVNLQDTLSDSEMINAVFRAAHSVKGGAAMLGFDSIQQTAHRLEDYFKVLKENPTIQVDQKLESLLLKVFDTFQELIKHLESALSLPHEVVNDLMAQTEPTFLELNNHLQLLVEKSAQEADSSNHSSVFSRDLLPVFQSQVMQRLREMLQLFKQPETSQSRQQLQEHCQQLLHLGEQFQLSGWSQVCEAASIAIANHDNNYRTLAPVIIKDLKQSQELVLAGRMNEVKTTDQLKALSDSQL
jgi:chemosensory pili system protein ChpA (sensor histidine kinase/response regulator)